MNSPKRAFQLLIVMLLIGLLGFNLDPVFAFSEGTAKNRLYIEALGIDMELGVCPQGYPSWDVSGTVYQPCWLEYLVPAKVTYTAIAAHSINPNGSIGLFNRLEELKPGDVIWASWEGVNYQYIVTDVFSVDLTNLAIVMDPYAGNILSLITCNTTPNSRLRTVVRARLVQ